MNDLLRRQRALDATLAKFRAKPFDLGNDDCVRLSRFHLVKMGHKRLPKIPRYSSPKGAMEALRTVLFGLGIETDEPNLEQLFDALLPRIAPAQMLPGDLALVPSDPDAPAWRAGTVVISLGRKWISWWVGHEGLAVIEPVIESPFLAAWRA